MKNEMIGTYFYGEESHNFTFGTDLFISDKMRFVNSVVSLLVNDTNYNFILRDLIFDFYIVDIFSDFDTSELKNSSSFVYDVEQFLENTNIVDIIKANMEIGLLDELNKAIDLNIQYLTGIHPNPLNEALAHLLSTIENKINEVDLDSMMGMAQKFAGMTSELDAESIVNAYMNSDIHKKNLEDIAEVKKNKAEIAKNLDKAIKLVKEENKK